MADTDAAGIRLQILAHLVQDGKEDLGLNKKFYSFLFNCPTLVLVHGNDYQCVVFSDSLVLKTSPDTHVGAWWYQTVSAGKEWVNQDKILLQKY